MKKIRKFSILNEEQLKSIKGGSTSSVKCVCSCDDAKGTWTTSCNFEELHKSFYSSYCGGSGYATCGVS